MNPNTGHLIQTHDLTPEQFEAFKNRGYVEVPDELNNAAKKKLNGKKEAFVSLKSGGKLSEFARKKRKRKMQKTSRRANRK